MQERVVVCISLGLSSIGSNYYTRSILHCCIRCVPLIRRPYSFSPVYSVLRTLWAKHCSAFCPRLPPARPSIMLLRGPVSFIAFHAGSRQAQKAISDLRKTTLIPAQSGQLIATSLAAMRRFPHKAPFTWIRR